ncbi:hypothetical protein DEU56DRAFT_779319 [Suillus clintonianus]|uniref:uncharacterized protein n=1 Tax=Suillus clintonianus TaxID=1904413 RepID=UPI001B860A26|nr:uncharacterized protein DEU56DRAFT_779319 [Suillus clintonianus]KAG2150953.1 hypothetical protein DEU56DRAFT_779319 [Suillus clintonianus]
MSHGQNDAQNPTITTASSVYVVPWDGVYLIQNVGYHEQNIGLKRLDIINNVVGRHEDSVDPPIRWDIKATSVGEDSKITIKSGSSYIGANSEKVVYGATPYEWNVSYRDVGRWIIRDTRSNLLLYLPNGNDGTEVKLMQDQGDDRSYWRFIPIRPPSN